MEYARWNDTPTVHVLRAEDRGRSYCNRPYRNQSGTWTAATLPDASDPDAWRLICGECYTRLRLSQRRSQRR